MSFTDGDVDFSVEECPKTYALASTVGMCCICISLYVLHWCVFVCFFSILTAKVMMPSGE